MQFPSDLLSTSGLVEMKDEEKTADELIYELGNVRQHIAQLEKQNSELR